MSETPQFVDSAGKALKLGTYVGGGDGDLGKVIGFCDMDENGWGVEVAWPEDPTEPETFQATAPWPWEVGNPYRCDDVAAVKVVWVVEEGVYHERAVMGIYSTLDLAKSNWPGVEWIDQEKEGAEANRLKLNQISIERWEVEGA